ncbi:MAG TPA: ABC transporter ATP-binding protein [Bryobacteraceae bacterium]|nr:ABC transporter ATP-binding protein [Bryobacteraceae bacterium]
MEPVLELRGLTKNYGAHRAVDSVSLTFERGGFYSLLGPSGCGKTTTLRMIGGFETPDAGGIFLDGRSIAALRPWERDVSTVFQSYALFPHLTAVENVAFGLRERRVANARERAMEALALVELGEKSGRLPAQLSGGEKQRVALARSLVLQPKVLLLDEPLAALDPKLRKQMRAELKAMQRRTGITFLLVTHDQEEAMSLSDKLAVMNQGRIEQFASPEEVWLRPATRFAAGFLGAVNWFGETGVRPEVTYADRERPALNGERDGARRAIVQSTLFLGNRLHVHVRCENGDCAVAEVARGRDFADGESVWLWWNSADEMRFE